MGGGTIQVSGRRELLIDDFLLESHCGAEFRLHEPVELPADPGKPCGAYLDVFGDGRRYLMYYRGMTPTYDGPKVNGNPGEFVGVAESADGLVWTRPKLDFFPGKPVPPETVIFGDMMTEDLPKIHDLSSPHPGWTSFTHNFTPFYDDRPGVPDDERYKAVSGIAQTGGLFAFHSADGFRWKRYDDFPIIKYDAPYSGGHALDSQNVAFYSETEGCFVLYFRVWRTTDGRTGLRSFARATSQDFRHWSEPEFQNPNRPGEHLYVSGLRPYARAPQYYIGAATRYFRERGSATDVTLLFSRAGNGILRPFPGAWIAPGLDPERWTNRMNYIALGMIQTSPEELTLYHARKPIRYKLRTDGFVSLSAGGSGGTWRTKALSGKVAALELNLRTSAGGSFKLELCGGNGLPLPGYGMADFDEFYGDAVEFEPKWRGKPAPLLDGVFRLRAEMTECDVFSIAFR